MDETIFTLIKHIPGEGGVETPISIRQKPWVDRRIYGCRHPTVEIDEDLWCLACRDCGEKLDPIRYLIRWAHEEIAAETRLHQLREECRRIRDIVNVKTKAKCNHCGKITNLKTNKDIRESGLLIEHVKDDEEYHLNVQCRNMGIRCTKKSEHDFFVFDKDVDDRPILFVCRICGVSLATKGDEYIASRHPS